MSSPFITVTRETLNDIRLLLDEIHHQGHRQFNDNTAKEYASRLNREKVDEARFRVRNLLGLETKK